MVPSHGGNSTLHIPVCLKLLDVGCSDHRATRYLAEQLKHEPVIGIDLVEDMIRHTRVEYEDIKNLSFQQMSTAEIEFNLRFDIIF